MGASRKGGSPYVTDIKSATDVPAEEAAVGDDDQYAGQILDGAKTITRYLVYLGFTDMTEKMVFHWAADGRLPVLKIGNRLVTNKRAIHRHFGLRQ